MLSQVIKKVLSLNKAPKPSLRQREWSIGIYLGESPFHFESPKTVSNPVLTRKNVSDVEAAFVADPFMLEEGGMWYMFFEVMNRQSHKGEIGLATSRNGGQWTYQQIVLAEPFHLSYPYVFSWMNNYYMIPESYKANSIRVYKALEFPTRWLYIGTLLSGPCYLDASIFQYNNLWWLFTETNPAMKHDTLRLYYAADLMGPWLEHSKSPLIEGNRRIARPGGRVVIVNDEVVRYAQDCCPTYGTQVRAFEITKLTTTSYREREVCEEAILVPSGNGWNECGMHHIDPHLMDDGRWLACVDGWFRVEPTDSGK